MPSSHVRSRMRTESFLANDFSAHENGPMREPAPEEETHVVQGVSPLQFLILEEEDEKSRLNWERGPTLRYAQANWMTSIER